MRRFVLIIAGLLLLCLLPHPIRNAVAQENDSAPSVPGEQPGEAEKSPPKVRVPAYLPFPEPLFCEPPPPPRKRGKKDETLLDRSGEAIENTFEGLSGRVDSAARWIDSFFSDPRYENEVAKSRLRLQISAFVEEEEAVQYDLRARLRLSMPLLSERLHLLISGDPEEEEEFQPVPLQEVRQQFIDTSEENVSASVRYFLFAEPDRNASLRGGFRLRSGIPTPFVEPRFRLLVPLEPWLFRFTQRVIWLMNDSLEVRTTFDWERVLLEQFLFRTTAEGSWFREESGYFYQLSFTLFQPLCDFRALEYNWVNFFETQPDHRLEEVQLRFRYRQKIFWDWLFFDIAPQIAFPHDRDYRWTPGILVRLEGVFGENY